MEVLYSHNSTRLPFPFGRESGTETIPTTGLASIKHKHNAVPALNVGRKQNRHKTRKGDNSRWYNVCAYGLLFLRNSHEIMYQASPTFHTESDKNLDRAWEQGYTSRLWHMWKCGNCLALYNLPELVLSLSA